MTIATSFQIPAPIQAEHQALHAQLAAATREPGELGAAARDVARLLHPHFVREEEFALPPLALLAPLARGDTQGLPDVVPMTRRLKAELPSMLAEHQEIVGALHKLRRAAREAARVEHAQFADALIQHAQMEESVLYPAALLVGELAELRTR